MELPVQAATGGGDPAVQTQHADCGNSRFAGGVSKETPHRIGGGKIFRAGEFFEPLPDETLDLFDGKGN